MKIGPLIGAEIWYLETMAVVKFWYVIIFKNVVIFWVFWWGDIEN